MFIIVAGKNHRPVFVEFPIGGDQFFIEQVLFYLFVHGVKSLRPFPYGSEYTLRVQEFERGGDILFLR